MYTVSTYFPARFWCLSEDLVFAYHNSTTRSWSQTRKNRECQYGEPPEDFYHDDIDTLRKKLPADQVILPTRAPLQKAILRGASPEIRLSVMLMDSLSDVFPSNMLNLDTFEGHTTDSILHSQVCRIIQSSRQCIDDSTSRYFNV